MSHPSHPSGPPVVHRPAPFHPTSRLQSWLLGRPLPTAAAPHQAINKRVGLAVFASDALSSTAYATQEILVILAVAGAAAFSLALPISLAIVLLLAIVTFSYTQTIHAYPGGGGAYIVARDNLGELPAQIAGAALLTDYILTVAVSVSAGVAQITSAFPVVAPYRVGLAVLLVMLIALVNLRGVKESGAFFAVPTYFFLGMISLTVALGISQYLRGDLGQVADAPHLEFAPLAPVTLFLLLRAFSNGTTALTGVEAISNGISAFRDPRSRNAAHTLVIMAVILGALFVGITFLAVQTGAVPSESETVVSQIARTVMGGRGLVYLAVVAATTLILILAANTAFADFPRLGALHAADGFLPRQFTFQGSRLVYSWGILALALFACILIIVFQASVSALIPLYAVGVFLSFTLSQTGMARRWWKIGQLAPGAEIREAGSTLVFERGWHWKILVNAFGALCTGIVMLVFAVTKFRDGAWIVLFLVPVLVTIFFSIHRHYRQLAGHLSLQEYTPQPAFKRQRVILPIGGVHRGTLQALRYARTLSEDVTAVHVATDVALAQKVEARWEKWGQGLPLVFIDSPYREQLHPLVSYIDEQAASRHPEEVITVVVPEFIPLRWWHNLLHMQTATWLRWALRHRKGVVVVDVPYQVE